MIRELEDALARWEAGDLSREQLLRRFPEEDVAGVLASVERMRTAAAGADPDAADAWEIVRTRLPSRLPVRRGGRARAIRLLAAALVAVLLMGATAYALVPTVRRAVNGAVDVIFGEDDRPLHQMGPTPSVGEPSAATPSDDPSNAGDEAPGGSQGGDDPDGDGDAASDEETTEGDDGTGSDVSEEGPSEDDGSTDADGSGDGDTETGAEEARGAEDTSVHEGTSGEDSGSGFDE
jgi:hypothetical protein